jgi:glycosyltransferase involved in cell wall biosynthesis
MAAGLPVVSTRVGALSEVVQDGVTGLLISPGDGDALARALTTLVEDPHLRRSMGARGAQRAAERFDALANGRRLLALLRSLTDAPAGTA